VSETTFCQNYSSIYSICKDNRKFHKILQKHGFHIGEVHETMCLLSYFVPFDLYMGHASEISKNTKAEWKKYKMSGVDE